MDRQIIATGAFLAMTGVILGAFGAHALKKVLDVAQLTTFETGVRYQMYHALMLLFVGTSTGISDITKKRIYYLVLIGVILFSGSIYLLATSSLAEIDFGFFGIITPIGGLLLIISWLLLLFEFMFKKNIKKH